MTHRSFFVALLVALICLPVAGRAGAQDLSIRAFVDRNTVTPSETVTFTVEIEGTDFSGITAPAAPLAEGLTLVSRFPQTRRMASVVNGVPSQSISFSWGYRPQREGRLRIGAASVGIKGRTYETSPITITAASAGVAGSGRTPPPPLPRSTGDADLFGPTDLFVRATTDKSTLYPNEQLVVSYRLYYKQGIQVRESRLTDSWDADGFWREDLTIDPRPRPEAVVENGIRYNVITLKRVALFPTRAGALTVEPLRIRTEAYAPYAGGGFGQFFGFGRGFGEVDLSSGPLRVQVQPFPTGAPDGFAGAVGQFTMNAAAGDLSLEAGEPLELTLTVRGAGNLPTLAPPTIEAPGAFERYDPDVSVELAREGARLTGTKTFRYVLVPRVNGRFEIPAVRFSYFDPSRGAFVTDTTASWSVNVTGASESAEGVLAGGLPVDDIAAPAREPGAWRRAGERPLHERPGTYALMALPLLLLGGVGAARRMSERRAADAAGIRSRSASPAARRQLREAERLLRENRPALFYDSVELAVMQFLGARCGIPERGLTRGELESALATRGVAVATREKLHTLLDECDQARFAPRPPDTERMRTACNRAEEVITLLDAAYPAPRGGSRSAAGAAILLFLILAPAARANAERDAAFGQAVALYDTGRYAEAAAAYEAIRESGFESVGLYLNLGSAYYRLDRKGPAVLAFERARKLAPDDERVLHNLQIAQGGAGARRVPEPYFRQWLTALGRQPGAGFLFVAGWAIFAVGAGWLAERVWSGSRRRRPAAVAVAALGMAVVGVALMVSAATERSREAVVLGAVAVETESGRRTLPEGAVVRIEKQEDGRVYVRLPDGTPGVATADGLAFI